MNNKNWQKKQNVKCLSILSLVVLLFCSCKSTPEQEYREKMEKATEEELLSEVFKKSKVYKLSFKDTITDDIINYHWNESLYSDLQVGATVQTIFDGDNALYIGNDRFVGSYKNGYYSARNGRYQVTILSEEEFDVHPTIIKRVFSIKGIRYNTFSNELGGGNRQLEGVRKHPGIKSNVIVVKDAQGFVGNYNQNEYKPSTVVFKSFEPIGYYDGPRDKK